MSDSESSSGALPADESTKPVEEETALSEKTTRTSKKEDKKGIIYMSRVPPYMRPAKVRDLLAPYGEIGRIYLKPEDRAASVRRKKRGGNKKTKYTEGWVEFMDKEIAEAVADTLNATPIGDQVRKGSFFHNDLWCLKYLPDFKWHHLTEKKSYEKAVRNKRRRTEILQVKRENNQYLLAVEKAKSQKRRKEKSKRDLNEAKEDAVEEPGNEKEQLDKMRNRFRQRTVSKEKKEDVQELLPNKQLEFRRKRKRVTNKQAASDEEPSPMGGELPDSILNQIFGKRT